MEAPPPSHLVRVEPDYGQFYLRRAGSDAWASDAVPSVGYERHLWSNGTFVAVFTVRKYGTTDVRVEVLDAAPGNDPAPRWQHVVEESLVAGGDLEIFDWPGDEPNTTVPIPHEPVRLRVCWSGLSESNAFEGMDEDGHSDEHLLVQVWVQQAGEPAVVRWWPPLELPGVADRSVDGRRQIEGLERVLDAMTRMELVRRFDHPHPGLPGSIREQSSTNAVYRDGDGTLWADGYDVRRTLRVVEQDEVASFRAGA